MLFEKTKQLASHGFRENLNIFRIRGMLKRESTQPAGKKGHMQSEGSGVIN